jgi:6-phosphogluconolactonase
VSFDPSGKFVYVVDGMAPSIAALNYGATHGTFIWVQTISTLPRDFMGTSACAEVMVHPS